MLKPQCMRDMKQPEACSTCHSHSMATPAAGTEAGEKKIPESLGLAPGVVFLVCIVLTEQLHASGARWLQVHCIQGCCYSLHHLWLCMMSCCLTSLHPSTCWR